MSYNPGANQMQSNYSYQSNQYSQNMGMNNQQINSNQNSNFNPSLNIGGPPPVPGGMNSFTPQMNQMQTTGAPFYPMQ